MSVLSTAAAPLPVEAANAVAPLLSIQGLTKHFPARNDRIVHAVEDVSFDVKRGSTVGLVGESGSGKTTAGRAILRLIEPTGGKAIFDGVDLFSLSASDMRAYRRQLQIVFQDPFSSLNPRMRVAAILNEALDARGFPRGQARRDRVAELLTLVGLSPDHASRYPHEFSGGQRQRIGIARALAVEPQFIVADEPVSALDVSVQAQILNLLGDLQKRLGLTLLFIAHDLSVVEYLCDEVVVMYLGRVMERGPSRLVYAAPRHPYTKALLATAPIPDPTRVRTHVPLQGDIPSPINPPSGCVFRTRCPEAIEDCAKIIPTVDPVGGGHHVACIRHNQPFA
ncbi:peptide ABC transporter ATP-binding protein [Mesorhizobium sp. Root554]|nr:MULTISPECIES: ABC transporter ATP-binding protein [unclassified Mesorhizobium]KQZ13109.1 peptide ABC transporter ATP-binding protein [Mesorhizobium sp. Root1471]KQZ35626.1 peptide ABC transporter ATP-binding protein [Mesorhizobium sp. Root554]